MINSVVISGRLTKDVNLQSTQNGIQVARFTLAVNRTYKNKEGNYDADFINCIAFRKTAEISAQYLSKGDLCNLSGRIQTRNFENQQGERVFLTEVVADNIQLMPAGREQGTYSQNREQGSEQQNNQNKQQRGQNEWQRQNNQHNSNPFANANTPIEIDDDDLPF
ncbi:single-stranded DNA-binding protein [Staphylococcus felis]|uniref:single-stranded DNA-binding protein n=1 Tax=Staphylococcus felis TaxID=46127 RepID=UPI0039678D17